MHTHNSLICVCGVRFENEYVVVVVAAALFRGLVCASLETRLCVVKESVCVCDDGSRFFA